MASLAAVCLLQFTGKRQPAERVARAHQAWRTLGDPGELPLVASEGETPTAVRRFGDHARMLIDVEAAKLGGLLSDPSAATVTLRLDDDLAARQLESFEMSWRSWLRAWNLLQALPGAVLVTREALDNRGLSSVTQSVNPRAGTSRPTPTVADPRLAIVREVGDEAARAVLTELLTRHAALEAPAVPFELRAPVFTVNGDVEVGWHERKVAAYLDHQAAEAEVLRAAGWTVHAIERGLAIDPLARALGLEPAD